MESIQRNKYFPKLFFFKAVDSSIILQSNVWAKKKALTS